MYKNSVKRFNEIVKVLAFYGFGFIVDTKLKNEKNSPENLRKAFEELGPTFIKIGQLLSTRPDILPANYIEELSKLQDNVLPIPFDSIKKVFFSQFKREISDCFSYFNTNPLASASVAQVHEAVLKDGKEVIVKLQRPNIEEMMHLDINILKRIIRLTKGGLDDTLIDPLEALDEILAATKKELNFINEANNIKKFQELNKNIAFLHVPYVVDELTNKKVITMEKLAGFKIDNLAKLQDGGYDRKDLSKKLTLSYLKQIFEDGFFHGDPHPGNILILEGKLCYIDFGIMGNLSDSLKAALNEVIMGIAYEDINKIISVLMSIGIKKGFVNRNNLYEDIDYLFASYLSTSLQNIKISAMLQEILDMAKKNNLSLPKDFTLLIRGLVIIEGVVVKIYPDINILDIAVPYVKSKNSLLILEKIKFDELLINSYKFTRDFSKVPSKALELSDSLIKGRAKIQLEHKNLNKPIAELNKMVNRIVFALIISSMIMGSSLILNSNIGPKVYNVSILGITGFLIAAIMGFCLLISIIKSGRM